MTQYTPVGKLNSMFRGSSWIRRRAGVALLLLASLIAGTARCRMRTTRDVACSPIAGRARRKRPSHRRRPHAVRRSTPITAFLCHSLRSFYPAFDKFEQQHYGPRAERLHIAPIDRARIGGVDARSRPRTSGLDTFRIDSPAETDNVTHMARLKAGTTVLRR